MGDFAIAVVLIEIRPLCCSRHAKIRPVEMQNAHETMIELTASKLSTSAIVHDIHAPVQA